LNIRDAQFGIVNFHKYDKVGTLNNFGMLTQALALCTEMIDQETNINENKYTFTALTEFFSAFK